MITQEQAASSRIKKTAPDTQTCAASVECYRDHDSFTSDRRGNSGARCGSSEGAAALYYCDHAARGEPQTPSLVAYPDATGRVTNER